MVEELPVTIRTYSEAWIHNDARLCSDAGIHSIEKKEEREEKEEEEEETELALKIQRRRNARWTSHTIRERIVKYSGDAGHVASVP